MNLTNITTLINPIKQGTMFRVTYETEPALKAEASKAGYVLKERTSKTVRFARYGALKSVIARREASGITQSTKPAKSWYTSIVPTRLIKHNSKEQYYLSFANVPKRANVQRTWTLISPTGETKIITSADELKSMEIVRDSFWSEEDPATQNVSIENVIHIKQRKRED